MRLPPGLVLTILTTVLAAAHSHAQAPTDSAGAEVVDVSGKWRLTTGEGGKASVLTVAQNGTRLEANFMEHIRCLGRDVRMQLNFAGFVKGRVVRLYSAGGRLEGDVGDQCVLYSEYTGRIEFVGQISADGKKIVGPYDRSMQPTHTWTLTR